MENTKNNYIFHLSILTPLIFGMAIAMTGPRYLATDSIALNCGSSGMSLATDDRYWSGDMEPALSPIEQADKKSVTSRSARQGLVDFVPYRTSRISLFQFEYRLPVNTTGPKFIRLHFYPSSYPGFKRSNAVFSVKAGTYTLLIDFMPAQYADSLGLESFFKEFCINVEENHVILTFYPSSKSNGSYALINGIEIVSMPTNLYYSPPEGEGLPFVGQNYQFHIEYNMALKMIVRLNVGGGFIPRMADTGMFREWSDDNKYRLGGALIPRDPSIKPLYTIIPNYTAPDEIYQSAMSVGNNRTKNLLSNLTWGIPVDQGFYYLVRLHFCEFEPEITRVTDRQFIIYLDNKTAEEIADVFVWSEGRNATPVYRDYVVRIESKGSESKRDLFIALHPRDVGVANAILNGAEVFKLINFDGNLAGPNPNLTVPVITTPTSKNANTTKKILLIMVSVGSMVLLIALNLVVNFANFRRPGKSKSSTTQTLSLPEALCRRFSLTEIRAATDDFHSDLIIGEGGFGNVYKGYIIDRAKPVTVAIKRLNPNSSQGAREFYTEVEMLSRLRYIHLVSLIGYCTDNREMILVYDFMSNGTLRDHLYSTDNDPLPWKKRLEICIGAARGLHYLHTGLKHTIIHRDVKTTNILLDEKWVAKVSDFGLSKIDPSNKAISTMVKGTWGYLDPEYARCRSLTDKSDVYSFGVVLFEVLCSRKALDRTLEVDKMNLARWAQRCLENGTFYEVIDPYLMGRIAPECFKKFVEIATSCVLDYGIQRPTMRNVMDNLELVLQLQESADTAKEGISSGGVYMYPEVSFRMDPSSTAIDAYDGHVSSSGSTLTGTSTDASGMSYPKSVDFVGITE